MLHGTKKTRHIKLTKPINRPENGFKETGTDIFLKPGKRLNGIDGILLTNTKDQKIISNWKIGKISAYLCRKLKTDSSGADQVGFHSFSLITINKSMKTNESFIGKMEYIGMILL